MNILLICADEMRRDCLGCSGNPVIQTPNLDRLALRGVRFERAYSSSPLCVPARAQLLTGLACWQTEVWGLSDRLIPMVPTFAGELSKRGYFTGAVGKMHFQSTNAVGNIHEPHGFREMVLAEEILPADIQERDEYTRYLKRNGYDLGQYTHGRRSPAHFPEGFRAQISALPNRHFDTTWTGDETLRMLEAHAGDPFCIMASFVKPHFPCELPSDWPCPYRPEDIPFRPSYTAEPDVAREKFAYQAFLQRQARDAGWLDQKTLRDFAAYYYANVTLVDLQVGRILDLLEARGVLNDTLVIFTSDHGECLGERGCVGKTLFYEESAGVPLIVAGPMVTQPGRVDARPVILEDLYPTFLEAAGLPAAPGLIGASLLPLLRDPQRPGRSAIFGVMGGAFHFEPGEATCFTREGDWKYIYQFAAGREKLYNLAEDPVELKDLADDGAYRDRCRRLNRLLAGWFDANGAGFLVKDGRLRRDLLS